MPIQFNVEPLPKRVSKEELEKFLNEIVAPEINSAEGLGGRLVGFGLTNVMIPDGDEEVPVPAMVYAMKFPAPERM